MHTTTEWKVSVTDMTNDTAVPIALSTGTTVSVQDGFGDDWFPCMYIAGCITRPCTSVAERFVLCGRA